MDLNSLAGEKDRTELKRLISLLAHDLKSPIHNVIGFSSLLEQLLPNDTSEEIKYYIDIIRQEAETSLYLINSFSDCCQQIHPDFSDTENNILREILLNSKKERKESTIGI
jgi:signal transduction histidine kinase